MRKEKDQKHTDWVQGALYINLKEEERKNLLESAYDYTSGKMAFSTAMSLRRQFGPSMLRNYEEGFNQEFEKVKKAKSISKLREDMISRNKLRKSQSMRKSMGFNESDTQLISEIDSNGEKKDQRMQIFAKQKQVLKNQAINEAQETAEDDVKIKSPSAPESQTSIQLSELEKKHPTINLALKIENSFENERISQESIDEDSQ